MFWLYAIENHTIRKNCHRSALAFSVICDMRSFSLYWAEIRPQTSISKPNVLSSIYPFTKGNRIIYQYKWRLWSFRWEMYTVPFYEWNWRINLGLILHFLSFSFSCLLRLDYLLATFPLVFLKVSSCCFVPCKLLFQVMLLLATH